jgi:hypothetical protein
LFLVKDASTDREERIKRLSTEDAALAELLGVIHVEWTVRRAIIALGTSPNVEIRTALEQCHGLEGATSAPKARAQKGFTWQSPTLNPELLDNETGRRSKMGEQSYPVYGKKERSY